MCVCVAAGEASEGAADDAGEEGEDDNAEGPFDAVEAEVEAVVWGVCVGVGGRGGAG